MALLTNTAPVTHGAAIRYQLNNLARIHLPLVRERARVLAHGFPRDEAESAGLMGLADAIQGWDRVRPFAPYARRVIDARIISAARDWRWRRQAEERDDRTLSYSDELLAQVPDRCTTIEISEARTDILRALKILSQTERSLVLLHGKLGHPLATCAQMLELTPTQADTTYRRALRKMRHALGGAA